jgi:Dolichyl-phosphate-mannose-protein mannosyltransferase
VAAISSLVTIFQKTQTGLQQSAFKAALLAFGGLRIFTTLWMAAFSLLVPVNGSQGLTWDPLPSQFVLGVQPLSRLFLLPWYRWDTLRYIQIAQFGYSTDLMNTVWPPLYPLLIRAVEFIFPDPMLAALVVSSLAALFAFYLLYLLVAQIWDEALARKVLLFTVVFPTAFFFVAGYSESLFLLLAIASLLALKHRRWGWSGIFAGLASLTRVQGVLLALPLAWEAYRWLNANRPVQFKRLAPILAGIAIIPLAYGGYAVYVRYGLGSSWPLQSLESGWPVHFDWPWAGIWASFANLLDPGKSSGVYSGNVLSELAMSLLAIVLLILGWRKLPAVFHLYAWPLLISGISKVTDLNLMVSMPRYVLTLFPIFIVLALKAQRKVLVLAWFGLSAALQMFFLSLFYLRSFVG